MCRGVWVDVSLYDNNVSTDMCRTGVQICMGLGNEVQTFHSCLL